MEGFGEGVVEVFAHHRAHLGGGPVGGVGRGQEVGDLVGVGVPLVLGGGDAHWSPAITKPYVSFAT
jgi:hypothetical protein